MSWLAFLIAISTCWISCRNILLLLNLWFVVEMLPLKIVIIIPLEDLDPNKLNQLLFIIIVGWLIVILIACTIFVSILRCYKDFYINSFFPFTRILWNSLSVERFCKTCDRNCFKSSFTSIFHLYHVIFLSLFSCNSAPLVAAILVRVEPKLKETCNYNIFSNEQYLDLLLQTSLVRKTLKIVAISTFPLWLNFKRLIFV